jgi:spermidine synthase
LFLDIGASIGSSTAAQLNRASLLLLLLLLLLLQEIHIAEIDGDVPEVSKKYFPGMAVGFADPRVTVHICDGIK